MESIDAKPSVKACAVIRQSEVSCSFWADWSSTIWLNAGCFALNTCVLQGLVFFSFSHAGNTILIVMLSVGEIFLSALASVEVRLLRAVLGCLFFSSRPHKHSPSPHTFSSTCFLLSDCLFSCMGWKVRAPQRWTGAHPSQRNWGKSREKRCKCCGVYPGIVCAVFYVILI